VLGIVGWVPCGVGSVLAIVFGLIARNQIRAAAGREGGAGMATAGIILGCLGLALMAYVVVAAIISASNGSTVGSLGI
jgi:hypothetical protein